VPQLLSTRIGDIYPTPSDGQPAERMWTNPHGVPIYLRQTALWLGLDKGAVADMWAQIRGSQNELVDEINWDHYQEPSLPHTITRSFAPDYFLVPAGGTLKFVAAATAWIPGGPLTPKVAFAGNATIWYTLQKP